MVVNTLDSRSLHIGDCLMQQFPVTDEILYQAVKGAYFPAPTPVDSSQEYLISVATDNGGVNQQHTVALSMSDGNLVPDQTQLAITAGDTVLWYTSDKNAHRFSIIGAGQQFTFSSGTLSAEAVYTHAFGVAGTYDWTDSIEGLISGTVEVSPVTIQTDAQRRAWLESLTTGSVFEIRNGVVTPNSISIVVGQTVFWKVWDGPGFAVTDKRLLSR